MKRRGAPRWQPRGGAIAAPDPVAMLALADESRVPSRLAAVAFVSAALHFVVAGAFVVPLARVVAPVEPAPLAVTLLDEPAPAGPPAPIPVPPAPQAIAQPVPPKPKPVARVAPKPAPKPAPVANPDVVAPPAPIAEASGEAQGEATPPVAAAPPSGGASNTGRGGGDAIAAYVAKVLREIEAKKKYPSLAKSRGVEGTVVVTLWISPAGGLERLEVGSNAPPLLVASTKDAIERAIPFPPPPSGMPSIRVPIRYALR
jgi:protein TonB